MQANISLHNYKCSTRNNETRHHFWCPASSVATNLRFAHSVAILGDEYEYNLLF